MQLISLRYFQKKCSHEQKRTSFYFMTRVKIPHKISTCMFYSTPRTAQHRENEHFFFRYGCKIAVGSRWGVRRLSISNFDFVLAEAVRGFPQFAQEDAGIINKATTSSFQVISMFPICRSSYQWPCVFKLRC